MSYNGWSNWETWAVYTEFYPTTVEDVEEIKKFLEEQIEELFSRDKISGFFYTLMWEGLKKVNWEELKEAMEDMGDEPIDEDEEEDKDKDE